MIEASHTPEQQHAPLPANIECLLGINRLLRLDNISRAQLEDLIDECTYEGLARAINPYEMTAIADVGHILKWAYCAEPGEELPPQIAIADSNGSKSFQINPDYLLDNTTFNFIKRAYFDTEALRDLCQEIGIKAALAKTFIDKRLRKHLRESAPYRIISSFEVRSSAQIDQPLSEYWRGVRKNVLLEGASQKYGLAAGALGASNYFEELGGADDEQADQEAPDALGDIVSVIHAEMFPQLVKLDEEVMPQIDTQAVDDGLNKAREYFIQGLKRQLHAKGFKYQRLDWADQQIIYTCDDDTTGSLILGAEGLRLAEELVSGCSDELFIGNGPSIDFLYMVLSGVLDPAATSLEAVIQSAESRSIDETRRDLTYRKGYGIPCRCVELTMPTGQEFPNWYFEVDDRRKVPDIGQYTNKNISITSQSEYERELRETRGFISGKNKHPVYNRIIQTAPMPDNLGPIMYSEDLCIRLTYSRHSNPNDHIAHIMGYEPVSIDTDGRLVGYRRLREADLYARATIPIGKEQQTFADICRTIGLNHLADAVSDAEKLTLADFVEMLSASTQYMFELPDGLKSFGYQPKSVGEFRAYVYNDKFYAQCSGSANLLAVTLNQVYGEGSAHVVSGQWVEPGASRYSEVRITGAAHAQVLFTHNNVQYVLDATGRTGSDSMSGYHATDDAAAPPSLRQVTPAAKQVESPVTAEDAKRYVPETSLDPAKYIDGLKESFLAEAKHILNEPDRTKVLKKLLALHAYDPLRLCAAALLGAKPGELQQAQLDKTAETIDMVAQTAKDHPERLPKAIKPPSEALLYYTKNLLVSLGRVAA